jgi:hypothetical protein
MDQSSQSGDAWQKMTRTLTLKWRFFHPYASAFYAIYGTEATPSEAYEFFSSEEGRAYSKINPKQQSFSFSQTSIEQQFVQPEDSASVLSCSIRSSEYDEDSLSVDSELQSVTSSRQDSNK